MGARVARFIWLDDQHLDVAAKQWHGQLKNGAGAALGDFCHHARCGYFVAHHGRGADDAGDGVIGLRAAFPRA